MRTLVLLLLVVVAGAGLWFLASGRDDGREAREYPAFDDSLDPDAPGPDAMRGVAAAPLVAVWGEDAGAPLPPLDFGEAMETILRFDAGADGLTGAGWLTAVRAGSGRRMPLRFISAGSLERFKALRLLDEAPPAQIDVPATLDWLRARGYVVEQRDTFLLIRPERRP
ncbi:MAG: hypothetical protein P1V36_05545 [Planctomycetota bacterium]|nr:hypothetical protein [Planctomycetota bacterium]